MTKETLKLIHDSYQEAVIRSHDILGIVTNLYEILCVADSCEEDNQCFDFFLDGVRGSKEIRKQTFKLTNLTIDINFVIMYIVIWLNNEKNLHIDINLNARRKSLESDLSKLLEKANLNRFSNIRDRFGLRGIVMNNSSSEELQYVYMIFDCISGIIANTNRKIRRDFINWFHSNSHINDSDKSRLDAILGIPFEITFLKDFIKSPKDNNYQTLQFTLSVMMYSSILPGAQVEIQLRTQDMHINAVKGSASHFLYKQTTVSKEIRDVFTVDDFSKVSIVGFTGYESDDEDIDGVFRSKIFCNRRISSTLVP